ncbi:MAG TPA: N-acetyltransferase [Anaerolineae bacterium]|nr:N-acetyltransferase [Anaerolineae bacterium]HMR66680.1 N-acetyltransferase [Anaerolineae bacterium]
MTTIRRARLSDVPRMIPLLEEYARQAEILPRTEEDVYRSIREWLVAENDVKIVGMASLLVMWQDLAEVRSLVISPECQGQGVGRRLVEILIEDARQLEIPRVFALTRKPGFFLKLGFRLTHIEKLPRKVKRDCVFCPKFHACDEAAVEVWLPKKPTLHSSPALELPHSGIDSAQMISLSVK